MGKYAEDLGRYEAIRRCWESGTDEGITKVYHESARLEGMGVKPTSAASIVGMKKLVG